MTLLDRIRTAPDDAQVSILYRAGTPGEMRGGEDIYSIEELRELIGDEARWDRTTGNAVIPGPKHWVDLRQFQMSGVECQPSGYWCMGHEAHECWVRT